MIEVGSLPTGEIWLKDSETGKHTIVAPPDICRFLERHPNIAKLLLEEDLNNLLGG